MSVMKSNIRRKMPRFSFAMNGELNRLNKTIFPTIQVLILSFAT